MKLFQHRNVRRHRASSSMPARNSGKYLWPLLAAVAFSIFTLLVVTVIGERVDQQRRYVEKTTLVGHLLSLKVIDQPRGIRPAQVEIETEGWVYQVQGSFAALIETPLVEDLLANGERQLCVQDRAVCALVKARVPVAISSKQE